LAAILIVDDESSMRYLLRMAFEMAGDAVDEAPHGRAALEIIEGGRLPDLVATDYMMPVMNGAELIDRLRRDPATAEIPIVLVSSSPGAHRRADAADDFVRKPFDPVDLVERAHALLRGGGS
jgi:two-component system phosphate regulon response regulator PhoB